MTGYCSPDSMDADKVTTSGQTNGRKSSKPVMEKKRRARINASLAELKTLLLDVIKNEGTRHSKMEKADILEMTVKHLRQIQRQHFSAASSSAPPSRAPSPATYHTGFSECTAEVRHYIQTVPDMASDVRTQILDHLNTCLTRITPQRRSEPASPMFSRPGLSLPTNPNVDVSPSKNTDTTLQLGMLRTDHVTSSDSRHLSPSSDTQRKTTTPPHYVTSEHSPQFRFTSQPALQMTSPAGPPLQFPMTSQLSPPHTQVTSPIEPEADTTRVQPYALPVTTPFTPEKAESYRVQTSAVSTQSNLFGGLQVVPTRLPSGEILFIVPNPATSGHIPNYVIPVYASPSPATDPGPRAASASPTLRHRMDATLSPTHITHPTVIPPQSSLYTPAIGTPGLAMTPSVSPGSEKSKLKLEQLSPIGGSTLKHSISDSGDIRQSRSSYEHRSRKASHAIKYKHPFVEKDTQLSSHVTGASISTGDVFTQSDVFTSDERDGMRSRKREIEDIASPLHTTRRGYSSASRYDASDMTSYLREQSDRPMSQSQEAKDYSVTSLQRESTRQLNVLTSQDDGKRGVTSSKHDVVEYHPYPRRKIERFRRKRDNAEPTCTITSSQCDDDEGKTMTSSIIEAVEPQAHSGDVSEVFHDTDIDAKRNVSISSTSSRLSVSVSSDDAILPDSQVETVSTTTSGAEQLANQNAASTSRDSNVTSNVWRPWSGDRS